MQYLKKLIKTLVHEHLGQKLKVNKIKKNTWSSRGNNSVVRWFY
jgi:hypothetical protein